MLRDAHCGRGPGIRCLTAYYTRACVLCRTYVFRNCLGFGVIILVLLCIPHSSGNPQLQLFFTAIIGQSPPPNRSVAPSNRSVAP
jgi:hypothetical protein